MPGNCTWDATCISSPPEKHSEAGRLDASGPLNISVHHLEKFNMLLFTAMKLNTMGKAKHVMSIIQLGVVITNSNWLQLILLRLSYVETFCYLIATVPLSSKLLYILAKHLVKCIWLLIGKTTKARRNFSSTYSVQIITKDQFHGEELCQLLHYVCQQAALQM